MLDPHQLAALRAVLRLGSFGAAARALHVTPSAISQRVKALEEVVGTSLVHRGQPCSATSAGRRIAKHAEDVALLESLVARDLSLEGPARTGRIRVAINDDSLATWFVDAMAACPSHLFDLQLDDQDYSVDWLRRGEVSAAVTVHGASVPGCRSEYLGRMPYVATASPGFVEAWFRDGVDFAAFTRAPCLTFDTKDALQRRWLRERFGAEIDPPSHFIPSTQGFLDANRAGLGWCLNPLPLAEPLLKRGAIVKLVDEVALDVALSWQVSQIMAPALAELTDAVRSAAKAALLP